MGSSNDNIIKIKAQQLLAIKQRNREYLRSQRSENDGASIWIVNNSSVDDATDDLTDAQEKAQKLANIAASVGIFTSLATAGAGLYTALKSTKSDKGGKGSDAEGKSLSTDAKGSSEDLSKAIADCSKKGKVQDLRDKIAADTKEQQAQLAQIEQMGVAEQQAIDTATSELETLNGQYETESAKLATAKDEKEKAESSASEADKELSAAQQNFDGCANAVDRLTAQLSAINGTDEKSAKLKASVQTKLDEAVAKRNEAEARLKAANENQKKMYDLRAEKQQTYEDLNELVNGEKGLVKQISAKKNELSDAKKALDKAKKEQEKAKAANAKWASTIEQGNAELAKYGASETGSDITEPEEAPKLEQQPVTEPSSTLLGASPASGKADESPYPTVAAKPPTEQVKSLVSEEEVTAPQKATPPKAPAEGTALKEEAAPTEKATEITYQVKKGDTFRDIAKKFNVDIFELMKINGYDQTTAHTLPINRVIQIPNKKK